MKILTDKVYYNGKEFKVFPKEVLDRWPQEPTWEPDENVHFTAFGDAWKKHNAALTRAIEEGYVVQTHFYELLPTQDPLTARSHQFYTLPEPREFEVTSKPCPDGDYKCADGCWGSNKGCNYPTRTAILLPKKEEIKPAPLGEEFASMAEKRRKEHYKSESLGESSEEQKRDFIQDALNAYYHQAVEILSTQTLGDIERRNYEYQRDTAKRLMTTSEPPEEQEELWISVQDRLPETNANVAVYTKNHEVKLMSYCCVTGDGGPRNFHWWGFGKWNNHGHLVTHWYKIPFHAPNIHRKRD